ncbi:hypothetical protein BGX24_000322 [Mortierella sp. AD032]|nr:hypothetical protein BGX24_000322 [Mortierella sp. AD032]
MRSNRGCGRASRYGYDTLTIFRPKLYQVLLCRIPAYKILFSKRVTSTVQSSEGIKVYCEDGSTFNGDILVAADGGASPIRKAMYTEIKKRTKKVFHPQDYALPKLDQRCIVGVTEPLSVKQYPILASKECEMLLVMPKDNNCMVWWVPMEGRRFGWGITSPLPTAVPHANDKNKKHESKSSQHHHQQQHLRETTPDITSSSFDTPHSPSSTHGGSGGLGHRQFSSLSGTSYSPPSSTSSSSIHNGYTSHNTSGYNGGGSDNGMPTNSSITSANDLKRRQSSGRLSKISSSSSNNSTSHQTNTFQKYPPVLVHANSTILTPPLELKDLPNDLTWTGLDPKYGIDESIREQPSPFGGTFGDILDATSRKMISMAVVEEKFYHTWHFGRTLLLGDGRTLTTITLILSLCALLPSSGHATTQAVLDSISLASLLYDLPSNSATDIEALFRVQFERRGPSAKAAVTASRQQDQLLFNRKLTGKFIRKMASNWVSERIQMKLGDRVFDARPILPFLKHVPARGTAKNTDKTDVPLTKDKRFEIARRKSVSSGYLTTGSGSGSGFGSGNGGGDRRGSFEYGGYSGSNDTSNNNKGNTGANSNGNGNGRSLDMTFETPSYPYSTSMPSVILPGGVMHPIMPMTRPMSSKTDIEGTLIPMLSRPPEKNQYQQESVGSGHWGLYQ